MLLRLMKKWLVGVGSSALLTKRKFPIFNNTSTKIDANKKRKVFLKKTSKNKVKLI